MERESSISNLFVITLLKKIPPSAPVPFPSPYLPQGDSEFMGAESLQSPTYTDPTTRALPFSLQMGLYTTQLVIRF